MSVRLQFPRGGFFSFERQFVVGGAALNLSGATLAAYLKTSPDDDDADALTSLTITVVDATQGTVLISLTAAQTADLPLGIAAYWVARAIVAGATYAPEALHGPVVLTPLQYLAGAELDDTGLTETLVPDETGLTLVPQWQPVNANLTAIAGLTSAADTVPYFTGAGAAALATLTSYARTLLATASAAAARTALGLAAIAASGSATDLIAGTVPDARFPATLPAISGANLTNLNASNLASGTVPDARFPATLPALNGSLLTALNATQLTSGTVPVARLYTTAAGYNITNGAALDALSAVATNGLLQRTAANTYSVATITTASGISWSAGTLALASIPNSSLTNSAITIAGTSTSLGGSITLDTIDNGLAATGLIARTAANTRAARTITGTAGQVAVNNGDGVSGNPTLSLPTALTGINSITSTALANLVLATGTFGTSITFASATGIPTFATHVVLEGVTSTGATGTGNFVFSASPTVTGTLSGATATFTGVVSSAGSNIINVSDAGVFKLGNNASFYGQVTYNTGANTILYIDNAYDNAGAAIYLRTRTLGTPVNAAILTSTAATFAGKLTVNDTTASTTTTTGSGIFGGGLGVAGAGFFGGDITTTKGADATSQLNVGTGGGAPSANRFALLNLNVPSSGSFFGYSYISYQRNTTGVWSAGIFPTVAGTMGTVADYTLQNSSGTNVLSLTPTGILTTAAGIVATSYRVGANQVVGARITGYTAMTGSPDKASAYATGSVTLAQLAGRVAQLQADLTTHGLIGT